MVFHTHVANTVSHMLRDQFSRAISTAFPAIQGATFVEITRSTQDSFGHYQVNSAMRLAKEVGLAPRKVAEAIVSCLDSDSQTIDKVEIAGPGFINIWLSDDLLKQKIHAILSDRVCGIHRVQNERIVIDFSSPNTAKEMHVGHLRSTIIGDCLARTFEFLGHDVLRLNHVGDWGTSFGMLIAYIKKMGLEDKAIHESFTLSDLVNLYRASKQLFDQDSAFKKNAQTEVVCLQAGDTQTVNLWKAICDISRRAYDEIYSLLNVKLVERGESFYNPQLADTVLDLEKRGLVTVSEGAKCIYLDGFLNREGEPLPLMIQKSDGGYNYDTTDMAAIRHRVEVEHASRLIYVTDAGQATHFEMIFKAAEKAGYVDLQKVRVDHVPFGLVLGQDGKKFRTRSGDTERLMDLLEAAVDKALVILKERNPDWSDSECQEVAQALGINAVKYSDLVSHRMSDYVFSYDKMLRFDGNTAAFVMYAYVRVQGIVKKVGVAVDEIMSKTAVCLDHPSEIALAVHLARFGEAVDAVAEELLPNRLTDYLYQLAVLFNGFFRDCRVEGSPQQNARLLLVEATGRILKQGLTLLGLKTVSRM